MEIADELSISQAQVSRLEKGAIKQLKKTLRQYQYKNKKKTYIVLGDIMRLSELQSKKIINITDGKNVGSIIDVNILEDGSVESLILESSRRLFSLNKELDSQILWKDITKIGEDVILVKTNIYE